MPYISLEEHLPGVTGLLEYRQDTAAPLREVTQMLMAWEHRLLLTATFILKEVR